MKLHSDIELFRSSDADLSRAVAHHHADAAIVAAPAPTMTRLHRSVLVHNPELKMFVVTNDGREAYLLELQHTTVHKVSPSGLIDAIRLAGGDDRRGQRMSASVAAIHELVRFA